MTTPLYPTVWYWVVSDTNPTTQVWESATGQFVSNTAANYLSWVANGGRSILLGVQEAQVISAADNGSGAVRLTLSQGGNPTPTTGMTTNDVWVVQSVVMAGATVVNGTWTITVVDGTHIDLQGSTFIGGDSLVTSGVIDRGTLTDTFADFLASPLDSYNQSLTQPKFASINLPGGTVSLTLPLPLIVDINCTAPGTLVLPQMNLFGSPGLDRLLIINNTGSAAFVLQDFGNTTLVSSVAAADLVFYWNESNTSKAGTVKGGVLKNINTVARGGTGVGSFTAHAILQSSTALGAVDSADLAAATAGNIPIDQGAGNAWLSKAVSGDISLSSAGVAALQNIPNDTPMAGDLLATEIVAPAAPAASHLRIYGDSTADNLFAINHGATKNHMAQSFLASASHWLIQLRDDGSWATSQPASTDLSDFTDWASWTPTWTGSGNSAAVTMSGVSAQFMRLKNIVFFVLNATISNINTATGTLQFTLPTTPNAAASAPGYDASNGRTLKAQISSGTATAQIAYYDGGVVLVNAEIPVITGMYKTS